MPVLNYEIKIKSIENGNVIEFKIPGKNCSEALGKLSSGKIRFQQPHPDDDTKMKLQNFHPNKKYVIVDIRAPGRSYPEMEGKVI